MPKATIVPKKPGVTYTRKATIVPKVTRPSKGGYSRIARVKTTRKKA